MELNHFPTTFATALAVDVGLYYEDLFTMGSQHKNFHKADKLYGCLRNFQKLSLFNKLGDSMVAYTGMKVTAKQRAALTIIHVSSRAWALGHIAETLINKLEAGDAKSVAGIAQTLLDQIQSDGGAVTPTVKRYVVNLAKLD